MTETRLWLPSTGAQFDMEQLLAHVARLRGHAERLGCPVKPGSRVAQLEIGLRAVRAVRGTSSKAPPAMMANGVRDLFELVFICDILARTHLGALRGALPLLLSGGAVPSNEGSTTPRDLQFQFYLAARFAHSGFRVVFEEPDFVFSHEGARYGVAAKRTGSPRQIVKRISVGASQVAKCGVPGFVAICVDHLLTPCDALLFVRRGDEVSLDDAARTLLLQTLRQYSKQIQRALAPTGIVGIVVSLTAVGFVRAPWQPAFTTADLWLPRADDLADEAAVLRQIVSRLKGPAVQ